MLIDKEAELPSELETEEAKLDSTIGNDKPYGNEKTIIEIRSEKSEKYKKLKNENNFREFDKYFYKYTPEKYRPDENIKIKKKDIKMLMTNETKPNHKHKRTKKIKNKGYFKTKKNGIKNVFGKFF